MSGWRGLLRGSASSCPQPRQPAVVCAAVRAARPPLACAVRLLDIGAFRIGSEAYAADNGTYGLVTLRPAHAEVQDEVIIFDYPAKHGIQRRHAVRDPIAARIVSAPQSGAVGDEQLLTAPSSDGSRAPIRSSEVSDDLKALGGEDATAKIFRTWQATVTPPWRWPSPPRRA